MSQPLKTFIIYAREDRDAVDDLRKHLKQAEKNQLLEIWDDGEILAGQDWDKAIKGRLKASQLILLFVSIDFINSDYIETTELQAALQRHRDGEATLIPVIVRRCDWQEHFGIGQFQALPKEARPIKSVELSIREEIYYEVAQGIKAVAQELKAKLDLEAERAAALAAEAQRAKEALAAEEEAKALREKEAQARAERQRIKDEAAWKAAVELDTLEAYEDYSEKNYTLHTSEAHERISKLEEADAKRRAAQKAKDKAAALAAEARRAKEAAEQKAKEVEAKAAAAKAKAAKEEAERKKREQAKREADDKNNDPFHDLMLPIKGGAFDMGSNEHDNENPVHRVTVRDFQLCKHTVTQAQWKAIMGDNPSNFKGDDLPVEQVSWDDAQAFIKKLNEKTGRKYRLPSEAEWEFVARGGTQSKGYKYAGSNDLDEVAWYSGNSGPKTHPVGQKKANELGLFDMSGNVWEWCEDHWHENYKGAPDDGSAWLSGGNASYRVLRGGAWYNLGNNSRVSRRNSNNPNDWYYNYGFRLSQGY